MSGNKLGNFPLYSWLSNKGRPRTYVGKILLIAFLGTHIPLLTLLAHFIISASLSAQMATKALLVALIATLAGTGVTLWSLHNLLQPIRWTCRSLREYMAARVLPDLPLIHKDEVGQLMADTQHALLELDGIISTLENYDALTGLPRRKLFQDRLQQTVFEARRRGALLAVLALDVVELKTINDRFGRVVGDQLLQSVSARLRSQARETDLLSHLGDDSFALIQTDSDSIEAISAQAKRLTEALSEPFIIEGQEIHAGLTIGISVFPSDGSDAETLLHNAEAAVFQIKEQKRSGETPAKGDLSAIGFYSAEMNARLQERLTLESELRLAQERGEFEVYYQPQIDHITSAITGMEALLRWNHPQRGMVSPGEFIPIAETTGLIVPIGRWVLETACAQNAAWQAEGLPPVRMGVNLSARQFQQPDLVQMVAATLEQTGLAPQWLDLEVTESMAMGDTQQAILILKELRALGVLLSLDDFGTGYSSLSQLQKLPITTLKIDRAFITDVASGTESAAITNSIIALARSLSLDVIAEGVETYEQLDYLQKSGCDRSQGFYFSRPVSASACHELLERKQLVPERGTRTKQPARTRTARAKSARAS